MKRENSRRKVDEGSLAPTFEGLNLKDEEVVFEYPLSGRVWLIFYGHARCSQSSDHFHKVNQIFPSLRDQGIRVITVFCSEKEYFPENFKKLDNPKTEIIVDPEREMYRRYGLEERYLEMSVPPRMLSGFMDAEANAREQLAEMGNGQFDRPAHFLIESTGAVAKAYYGAHYNDHLAWEVVRNFTGVEFPDPSNEGFFTPSLLPDDQTRLAKTSSGIVVIPHSQGEAVQYTGGLKRKDYDDIIKMDQAFAEANTKTIIGALEQDEVCFYSPEELQDDNSIPAGRLAKQVRDFPKRAQEAFNKSGQEVDSETVTYLTEALAFLVKRVGSSPKARGARLIRAVIDFVSEVDAVDFSNLKMERDLVAHTIKIFQLEKSLKAKQNQ